MIPTLHSIILLTGVDKFGYRFTNFHVIKQRKGSFPSIKTILLTSVIDIRSVKNDEYEDVDLDGEYDESLYEEYLQGSRLTKRDAYNYESCIEQYVEDGDESCLCDLLQGKLCFSILAIQWRLRIFPYLTQNRKNGV